MLFPSQRVTAVEAQLIQDRRGLSRWNTTETEPRRATFITFDDFVVQAFQMSCVTAPILAEAVQPQQGFSGDGKLQGIPEDLLQRPAVTPDFLLRAVTRFTVLQHKPVQPLPGDGNALDAV